MCSSESCTASDCVDIFFFFAKVSDPYPFCCDFFKDTRYVLFAELRPLL